MSEIGPAAYAVHARIRNEHRGCDSASCALRILWVEDVQEILNALAAYKAAGAPVDTDTENGTRA